MAIATLEKVSPRLLPEELGQRLDLVDDREIYVKVIRQDAVEDIRRKMAARSGLTLEERDRG